MVRNFHDTLEKLSTLGNEARMVQICERAVFYCHRRLLRREFSRSVQLASMPSWQGNFEKGPSRSDRGIQRRTPLALEPLYHSTRIR